MEEVYVFDPHPNRIQGSKEYFKSKGLVQEISSFVNNFLTLHQYFFNNYGIPSFKLDGRKILTKNIESESWTEVTYSSLQDTDFFEHLKESIVYGEGASDLVCSLAAEKIPLEPNWTLLIDGIRFFYEGNFRQTLISCCTSVEVTVTEPVKDFLESLTFTKGKDLVDKLMLEMGNPLRFEIYINSVNPEPYKIYDISELNDLISNLKFLNTTRNKVAHRGYLPSASEAKKSIEAASLFLRAPWFMRENHFIKT